MRFTTAPCLITLLLCGPAMGQGFLEELFTPSPGHHASPSGTPYVHAMFVEPAYLDRDLLIDYRLGQGVDGNGDEQELEFELEWALTERFGIVLEMPVVSLDPASGTSESGVGDMAVGSRLLLVDRPCFLMSAFLEIELPTGDASRGLGHGEAAMAPLVLWWMDLGNWTTFQGQFGPETGLESGETELIYHFALSRSWQGPVFFPRACRCCCGHPKHDPHHADGQHGHEHFELHGAHDDHGHHTPGLVSLMLEMTGVTALSDPDEGSRLEIIPGISYGLTEAWDLRLAARFPLYKPSRLDSQYIASAVRHF